MDKVLIILQYKNNKIYNRIIFLNKMVRNIDAYKITTHFPNNTDAPRKNVPTNFLQHKIRFLQISPTVDFP